MPQVKVGLRGAGTALTSYAQHFQVLEVQQTFYERPREGRCDGGGPTSRRRSSSP